MTADDKNAPGFNSQGSWYLFFQDNFQHPATDLLFENPCSRWDLDDFFEHPFIIPYGQGNGCPFKIDPDLLFRYAGKTDTDMKILAIIGHVDRRVKRSAVVVSFRFRGESPTGNDGNYMFFLERFPDRVACCQGLPGWYGGLSDFPAGIFHSYLVSGVCALLPWHAAFPDRTRFLRVDESSGLSRMAFPLDVDSSYPRITLFRLRQYRLADLAGIVSNFVISLLHV